MREREVEREREREREREKKTKRVREKVPTCITVWRTCLISQWPSNSAFSKGVLPN